ncbi:NUDIX domain-containing protein [Georgenia sp. MJ173]|uniref:NUDIX domain-containing protein n=1 Tax=Georgenia sunbinii TaxID=3117728 RepID=UPI002F269EF3
MTAERYRVVPAAYVLLLREPHDDTAAAETPEVLLQRRQQTGFMDGYWAAGAAGHVEAGESVHAAAVREAREELGIEVRPSDLRPLTTMHRSQGTGEWIDERVDFFFTARHWRGQPRPVETKAADLRWVSLADLDSLDAPVVPHERAVLDGMRSGDLPAITSIGLPGALLTTAPPPA